MATLGDIALEEPSTITARLAAARVTRNSTVQSQELMCIADPDSTTALAIAKVTDAVTLPSTTMGIAVRLAGGPSSAADVAIRAVLSSTNADNRVTVYQSTAGDLNVTVAGYSTTVNVSSLGGAVIVRSSKADHLASVYQSTQSELRATVYQSTAADLNVKLSSNSSAADYIPVRLVDSSGTGFLTPGNEYTAGSSYSSHAGPTVAYDNSSNNTYRTVGLSTPLPVQLRAGANNYNSLYSTVVSTASSAFYQLVSSVAAVRPCVYAYSVTSTAVANVLVEFMSGTVTAVWHTEVGTGSSGVSGANLAVAPPGRLFQSTAVALPINVRLGSTAVEVKLSVAWFTE